MPKFQSLIGRLGTFHYYSTTLPHYVFQSLIGRLGTQRVDDVVYRVDCVSIPHR